MSITIQPIQRRNRQLLIPSARTGSFTSVNLGLPVTLLPSLNVPESVATASQKEHSEPKKRKRRARAQDQSEDLFKLKFPSIQQASRRYPAFSPKAFYHLVAQAESYAKYPKSGLKSNGFLECIIRPGGGKKILIDAEKFESWLKSYAAVR